MIIILILQTIEIYTKNVCAISLNKILRNLYIMKLQVKINLWECFKSICKILKNLKLQLSFIMLIDKKYTQIIILVVLSFDWDHKTQTTHIFFLE